MQAVGMKVGELAKQTGVSVRTLHYYDEIKLLSPSHRTESDHRLYRDEDIVRLQQIMSLRQLGFSLEEVRDCLEHPTLSLLRVIQLHTARLQEQIDLSHKLLNRLETIANTLNATDSVSVENLIQTIEAITMYEKYYTPEQAEKIKVRAELLGEETIRQGEQDWQTLIEDVRAEMEKGTDPTSEPVQALAQRWWELIQAFTGGDRGIEQSLNRMYQEETPEVASRGAVDSALFEYMGRAIGAMKGECS
ncbi:MAG: MerR family transcriptional regulator [Cyanobacteria bacterium CRU_2_1]|nr:MerR family transcriptional regulator [Cyanobacteria bacterium RU_5_0]NJR59026.1 MerR family transcriptional regulator [Cyanobacteria bacterium CRU_2_1]